ncbi:MAG: hypothetical protein LBD05_01760 [Mycoplasmataceae bacterium]|jgi:hypothetical protein|nr:hypothetical protein [Mycoplasmataceae bacterium]
MKKNNYKYLTLCFVPLATIPLITTVSCGCSATTITLTEFKYGNVTIDKDVDTDLDEIVFGAADDNDYVVCHSSSTISANIKCDENFAISYKGNSMVFFMNDEQYAGLNECDNDTAKIYYCTMTSGPALSGSPIMNKLSNSDGSATYPLPTPSPGEEIKVDSSFFCLTINGSNEFIGRNIFTCYIIDMSFTLDNPLADPTNTSFSCKPTNSKFIIDLVE